MKTKGMKGMSLLVVLGFVMSTLMAFAPVGAASGRAGNFEMNVGFSDDMGGTTNESYVGASVNITVNVTIAAGMENVTELKVMMDINSGEESQSMTLGALDSDNFAMHTFQWMPTMYGDYTIELTAINGSDADNQTMMTMYYRAMASDITIQGVELTAMSALIGVDEVTVTAALANAGNSDGMANVSFYAGDTVLGSVEQDVPAGGNANAVLMTMFDGLMLEDGEYTIKAMMSDYMDSEATAMENITLTNPAPMVAVDSLVASAASVLEGQNVTLTAKLNNSGTADAMDLTVDFMDGATVLHTEMNVSVAMGQTMDVSYIWTLPDVAADTEKTVTAKVGESMASVNVTVIAMVAKINITAFTVPDGMRIGDLKNLTATVKNEGTGDATNLVVDFYDGTTKLVSSAPFNLSAGSSTVVSLAITLAGAADANHTFFVKATGAEKNATKMVGHTLSPAKVGITEFVVKPAKKDKQPADSTQSFTLTITLKNSGELPATNCTLTLKEGTKAITVTPDSIALDANGTVTKTYTWKVKGSGSHTATATLSGADAGTPATLTAKCTLEYTPGFEVLFLVAAILVAAILVRRRKN